MVTGKKIQEQLTKNLLPPIILDLLENHPMHGYELMLTIRKTYGVNLGASSMYPTLTNLENRNLVTSEWDMGNCHPKKVYKLTQEGQNELNYSKRSLIQICKALDRDNKKIDQNIKMGLLIE